MVMWSKLREEETPSGNKFEKDKDSRDWTTVEVWRPGRRKVGFKRQNGQGELDYPVWAGGRPQNG